MSSTAKKESLTLAISAKDAEDIIVGCLESIKEQSVAPDAVFVVVDTEDDTTIPVAKKYGAEVHINEKGKLYNARNTALKHCKTEFLAFTDADCRLGKDWVKSAKKVFADHPDVVAGTGPHPMIGGHNLSSWLHHMFFVVETQREGVVDGVIGGNSYFRTKALREAGGWPDLFLMAAEDLCISERLKAKGGRIWFSEGCIANHHYKRELWGMLKQVRMMGHDIIAMMRATNMRGFWWYYTLAIPAVAALALIGLIVPPLLAAILAGTLAYHTLQYKSLTKALPRWLTRWILIWPYSWGIIQGLREERPAGNADDNRRVYDEMSRDGHAYLYTDESLRMLDEAIPRDVKILDLGCGTGEVAEKLPDREWHGIDVSPGCIKEAEKFYTTAKVGDITKKLPYRAGSFDVVTSLSTIHHVPDDLDAIFGEVYRVLRKDGVFIAIEHDAENLYTRLSHHPKSPIRVVPCKDERALYKHEVTPLLEKHGFADITYEPMDIVGFQQGCIAPLWRRILRIGPLLFLKLITRGQADQFLLKARK